MLDIPFVLVREHSRFESSENGFLDASGEPDRLS
jgi:hypothetical protein